MHISIETQKLSVCIPTNKHSSEQVTGKYSCLCMMHACFAFIFHIILCCILVWQTFIPITIKGNIRKYEIVSVDTEILISQQWKSSLQLSGCCQLNGFYSLHCCSDPTTATCVTLVIQQMTEHERKMTSDSDKHFHVHIPFQELTSLYHKPR